MIIDCETCPVRGRRCANCVVSVLLDTPDPEIEPEIRHAIDLFAEAGMLPGPQLVAAARRRPPDRRVPRRRTA